MRGDRGVKPAACVLQACCVLGSNCVLGSVLRARIQPVCHLSNASLTSRVFSTGHNQTTPKAALTRLARSGHVCGDSSGVWMTPKHSAARRPPWW